MPGEKGWNKYDFTSFFLFGAVHVVTGLNMYRFLQTGTIGFAFAVIYLKSGNVLIPMILHFLYDIFANLTDYATWNNSPLFINLNSIFDIVLLLLFVTSLLLLLRKGKDKTLCRGWRLPRPLTLLPPDQSASPTPTAFLPAYHFQNPNGYT